MGKYTVEFMVDAVVEYARGGGSKKVVAGRLGISSSALQKWSGYNDVRDRIYQREGITSEELDEMLSEVAKRNSHENAKRASQSFFINPYRSSTQ